MENSNPKVFICHASEDKSRFVLDFAKKLRDKGIDAWVDKWEMQLGHSLVDKIFEEGIGRCDVFMIILSNNSISKKWVKEELKSAFIRKIEDKIRIIPLIIDPNIKVPVALNHLLWIKIIDFNNYEEEFKKIVMSIYNVSEKPPLGDKPKFLEKLRVVPGFSRADSVIFKITGDIILKKDDTLRYQDCSLVIDEASQFELSKDEIIESLEILESNFLLNITRVTGGMENSVYKMTPAGFVRYCENFLDNFVEIHRNLASLIMNSGLTQSDEITEKLGCPLVVVVSLLEHYERVGYLKTIKESGFPAEIFRIEARGKRYFRKRLEA